MSFDRVDGRDAIMTNLIQMTLQLVFTIQFLAKVRLIDAFLRVVEI